MKFWRNKWPSSILAGSNFNFAEISTQASSSLSSTRWNENPPLLHHHPDGSLLLPFFVISIRLNATPERFEILGGRTKYLPHRPRGYNWPATVEHLYTLAGERGRAIWLLASGRGNNIERVEKKRFGHRWNCCNTVTKGSLAASTAKFPSPPAFSFPFPPPPFKSTSSNEEDFSLDQFLVEIFPIIPSFLLPLFRPDSILATLSLRTNEKTVAQRRS